MSRRLRIALLGIIVIAYPLVSAAQVPPDLAGTPMPTTRTYTKVAGGYEFVDRVNGKVTTTTRVTIAADGKTRTNVATGVNAAGQRVNNIIVYERQ